jgi:hypothetical protein
MKIKSKKSVFILGALCVTIGFIVYQYLFLNDILFSKNIFGFQETVDIEKSKNSFSKAEYLKENLSKEGGESLKNKASIKKANPFFSFQEKSIETVSNKEVGKPTNPKTFKDEKPKAIVNKPVVQNTTVEEEQYFYSVKGEEKSSKEFFLAVIKSTQSISEGKLVSVYLKEDIPSIGIKANTQLLGTANLEFNRIKIKITSMVADKKVQPINVDIFCYDQDFNEGIFFENEPITKLSSVSEDILEDVLEELDSKPINITRKYLNKTKSRSFDNEAIILAKGKELFLSIIEKGE